MTTTKRRRLGDLYVKGTSVVFEDTTGAGDDVAIWVQRLVPFEVTQCAEKAAAAQAMWTLLKFKDASDEKRLAILAKADYDNMLDQRTDMIDFLIAGDVLEAQSSCESELAEEEEWAKDSYLDGLRESWLDKYKKEHHTEPTPESEKVWAELCRFSDKVDELVDRERVKLRRDYAKKSNETLREEVVDKLIAQQGNATWLQEYTLWEVFFSCRDSEDHRQRYFHDIDEVRLLDDEPLVRLVEAINELNIQPQEVKD